ncbi:hypothetical protein BDW60DRAFT_46281 [Aspergillus nidulans var. acristatus]
MMRILVTAFLYFTQGWGGHWPYGVQLRCYGEGQEKQISLRQSIYRRSEDQKIRSFFTEPSEDSCFGLLSGIPILGGDPMRD